MERPRGGALEVLYEDNHLIAVNKRPGDIVQADRSGDAPLSEAVKAYLKERYHKPGNVFLGVTHRLDRPTSGVVLFARTGKALRRLNDTFRRGEAEKRYWAVVQEAPPAQEGELVHYLERNAARNRSYAREGPAAGAKEARMQYRLLLRLHRYFLLEVLLLTGRHHQIRAQLERIGCHIKGDLKYGARRSNPDGGIHLHARSLALQHPVGRRRLSIVANPPADPLWDEVLRRLEGAG